MMLRWCGRMRSAAVASCATRPALKPTAALWFPITTCERGLWKGTRHAFCVAATGSGSANDNLQPAPGVESPGDKFVMIYTCSVCDTRAAKTISKHAYYNGVVLVRCPGCENLHLIADRLGWFEDESTDVESILKAKGEEVRFVTHENVLEMTEHDVTGKKR